MASRLESDIRVVKIGLVDGIEASIGEMALSVFSSVVIATPVDTGRLRGNWQPSFGTPATNALIQTDKGGQRTISQGTRVFALYPFGEQIFITNNVAYAQAVNEGGGNRPPAGFVQKAIMAGIANLDGQGELF